MNTFINTAIALTTLGGFVQAAVAQSDVSKSASEPLPVRKCQDFDLTGKGSHPEWKKTNWNLLSKIDAGGKDYESKFKILYSTAGIYVLFQGQDDKITSQAYGEQGNIFNGDAFEVFLHPNPLVPVYFEYEVNQMDTQLILMLSNLNGQRKSWGPWHHEGKNDTGIKRMVDVVGGGKELNAKIQSWSAEIFFPYEALGLLPNAPPQKGARWNANFCRLDYDTGKSIKWSWTPTIKSSFHELEKFRSMIFE